MHHLKEPESTIEDLMALPEDDKAELINGRIYMMAPASLEHSRTCGALTSKITVYVETTEKGPDDPDSWVIIPEAWTYYDPSYFDLIINTYDHNQEEALELALISIGAK